MSDDVDNVVVTTHHIFRKSDRLGIGASCEVYKGIHKDTCRPRALKIFRTMMWASSLEVYREINALRKLKHKNIISYYGHEQEVVSGRKLLVLELCNGGSLHTCLQEPEHVHGLLDKDLLLLIDHLDAGIKYLNERGFLHRDIKPGNVLRDIALDGTITFKLSDFGTSRQMSEGEEFMSLVGTEEYLHPDMYERAFVNRQKAPGCNDSADAWSLGCTLYHACAGDVPFKPFGGARGNRQTMFQMIKFKPQRAISGAQITAHGTISWKTNLPETCNMSKDLRRKVEPVLSDLLQCSSRIADFHASSSRLLRLIPVSVISGGEATLTALYLSPRLSYTELTDQLAATVDVPAHSQLSFVKGKPLSDLMKDQSDVAAVIKPEDVVIVMSMQDADITLHSQDSIDPYPGFSEMPRPTEDIKVAVKCSTTVFKISELITAAVILQRELTNAANVLKRHVECELDGAERQVKRLMVTCEQLASRLGMMREMENQRRRCTHAPNAAETDRLRKAHAMSSQLHMELFKAMSSVAKLKLTADREGTYWDGNTTPGCTLLCIDKAKSLFTKSKEIWTIMSKRKNISHLSEFDRLLHQKDKKEIEEICALSVSLWQDHCRPNKKKTQTTFVHTKRYFLRVYMDVKHLQGQIAKSRDNSLNLTTLVMEVWAFCGRGWTELAGQLTDLRYTLAVIPEKQSKEVEQFKCRSECVGFLEDDLPDLEDPDSFPPLDTG